MEALRDEGRSLLRALALTKEARDGAAYEDLFGRKDLIFQPRTSMLSLTILMQFFPNSGRFPPQRSCLVEILLNYDI